MAVYLIEPHISIGHMSRSRSNKVGQIAKRGHCASSNTGLIKAYMYGFGLIDGYWSSDTLSM